MKLSGHWDDAIMLPFDLLSVLLLASITLALPNPRLEKRLAPGVPQLPYPPGGNDANCPISYSNLFYQGIQKRDVEHSSGFPFFEETKALNYSMPPEAEVEELRKRSLEPRQFRTCANVARFEWSGCTRPLGNTQDLFLLGGSTYTFAVSCTASIKLAYAWTAPYSSNTYTLVGTGGNGGNTANVVIEFSEDSHVHFQAFSDFTMTDGAAAVFKQER